MAAALALSGPPGWAQAPAPTSAVFGVDYAFERMTATRTVRDRFDDGPVTIVAYVYRPLKNDRREVVLVSHGSTGGGVISPRESLSSSNFVDGDLRKFLLQRGYTLVMPMRRGVGESTGTYAEECAFQAGQCSIGDATGFGAPALEEALATTSAVFDQIVMARLKPHDGKVITYGGSRGGFLSLAFAGARPDVVRGVLALSPGWMSIDDRWPATDNAARLAFHQQHMGTVGQRFKGPTQWIYAARDPFYPDVITRQFHDAFRKGGGIGDYLLIEDHPLPNGHVIPSTHWRSTAENFFRQLETSGAGAYPARPVRIVEPFGAGGGPDLLARALAQGLSAKWGQPVLVENLVGAGATAAPARVASAPADGYTLLLNTSAQAYTAALVNRPPYDPVAHFTPIAALTQQPYVLVTGKGSGVSTVRDLIAMARSKPGQLKFGSTGPGTGTHFGAVKFNRLAGITCVDVPPEANAGIAGVLAGTSEGRTTYMFAPISAVTLSQLREGRLVALGVSTGRRSSLLPDVPTIAEAGLEGFDFPIWYGLWAPTGTPSAVIDQLAEDTAQILSTEELGRWLAEHGAERLTMTQPEFSRFVQAESVRAVEQLKGAEVR